MIADLISPARGVFSVSALRFVASFGVAKAVAMTGPLFLLWLMPVADYGAVELGFSIGIVAALVAVIGVPAAATQMHLLDGQFGIEDLLAAQTFLVAACALGIAAMLWVANSPTIYLLGTVMTGLFAVQSSLSIYCRIHQARSWSGWFDNLCLVLLMGVAGLCYASSGMVSLNQLIDGLVLCLALGTLGAFVVFMRFKREGFVRAYRDTLSRGAFMMTCGLMLLLVTSSLRLYLGRFLPLADVATYSACARLCLVLVVVHQLVVTGRFRSVYRLTAAASDPVIARFIAVEVVLGVFLVAGFYGVSQWIRWGALDLGELHRLLPIVCTQTILWITTAWLESLVAREGLAARATLRLALLLATFTVLVAAMQYAHLLTLISITIAFDGLLVACVVIQMRLLARRGFAFPRLSRVLPIVLGIAAIGWL